MKISEFIELNKIDLTKDERDLVTEGEEIMINATDPGHTIWHVERMLGDLVNLQNEHQFDID